ncbi:hypothetical protein D3C84_947400 [compost metagenome]
MVDMHFQAIGDGICFEVSGIRHIKKFGLLHTVFFELRNSFRAASVIFRCGSFHIVHEVANVGRPDRFECVTSGLTVNRCDSGS